MKLFSEKSFDSTVQWRFDFRAAEMDIIMPCTKRLSADLSNVNGSECSDPIPVVQFSKSEIQNFLSVSVVNYSPRQVQARTKYVYVNFAIWRCNKNSRLSLDFRFDRSILKIKVKNSWNEVYGWTICYTPTTLKLPSDSFSGEAFSNVFLLTGASENQPGNLWELDARRWSECEHAAEAWERRPKVGAEA